VEPDLPPATEQDDGRALALEGDSGGDCVCDRRALFERGVVAGDVLADAAAVAVAFVATTAPLAAERVGVCGSSAISEARANCIVSPSGNATSITVPSPDDTVPQHPKYAILENTLPLLPPLLSAASKSRRSSTTVTGVPTRNAATINGGAGAVKAPDLSSCGG
jgi:hypothetical protein